MKKLLILGAGTAGTMMLNKLRKKHRAEIEAVKKDAAEKMAPITKHPEYEKFRASLHKAQRPQSLPVLPPVIRSYACVGRLDHELMYKLDQGASVLSRHPVRCALLPEQKIIDHSRALVRSGGREP